MQNLSCVAGSPGSWVCLPWTRCGDLLVHQELPGDSTAPGSAWKGARSRAVFPSSPSCGKELSGAASLFRVRRTWCGGSSCQSCSSGCGMAAEIRKAASRCWSWLPWAHWAPQPESLRQKSAFWGARGLPAVSMGSECPRSTTLLMKSGRCTHRAIRAFISQIMMLSCLLLCPWAMQECPSLVQCSSPGERHCPKG